MRTVAPHLIRALPFLIPLDAAVDRARRRDRAVGLRIGDALRPPRAPAAARCRRRGA